MIPAWEEKYGMKLLGITDTVKAQWNYMNDHAAKNETSITMYVQPELVDLSVFPQAENSPLIGVNGEHPFFASREYGKELFTKALEILKPWIVAI